MIRTTEWSIEEDSFKLKGDILKFDFTLLILLDEAAIVAEDKSPFILKSFSQGPHTIELSKWIYKKEIHTIEITGNLQLHFPMLIEKPMEKAWLSALEFLRDYVVYPRS